MVDGVVISYNKLWKLLVDRKMNKQALRKKSGVTTTVMVKLGKNGPVHMEALIKICRALNCDIGDIVEITFSE